MTRPAIFLDRDGTLIEDVGFPHRPEDLRILPGVETALARLQRLDYSLVLVTNQSGIARGYFSEDAMHAFHALLRARLEEAGVRLAAIYHCPYHPEASIARYRRDSPLRKPRPGMLLLAAEALGLDLAASYMVGDKRSDVLAGQAAGCRTVLLQSGKRDEGVAESLATADFVAVDLSAAVERIAAARENAISRREKAAYPACPVTEQSVGVRQ